MTNPLSLSIKANGFYFKKDLSYHLKQSNGIHQNYASS